MDLTSSTDHDLEDMSANLRAKLIDEDRVFIVHISDIGKMDGYKNHLLQQLIRLPRGTYKQLVVDLSCTCLLYTSPSPRDATLSRMPSSA